MKKCNRCAIVKNNNEYYETENTTDGLYGHCKQCHQKHIKDWKKKYPEKYQKYLDKRLIIYRKSRGIPFDKPRMPKKCPEGTIDKNGYRVLRDQKYLNHPCCSDKKGRMLEHRLIMYNHLGRPLKKSETIHHKNGIRHDNRLENLELRDSNHGPGQCIEDKIKYYIEFLESWDYTIKKK